MKVLVAGNLVNHGYFHVKSLRKMGLDIELLIKKNSRQEDDPKCFDLELQEYPSWIKFWDQSKSSWKLDIVRIMKKYDVIHASTELPIFALFSGKPFIAIPTGSDILELVYQKNLKGILLKIAYHRAKIVVFPATHMIESIKKIKIKNSIFIPWVWDFSKFSPKDKQKNDKFIIFHPTNHVWDYKKNDIFLKAFVKLAEKRDDIHLIITNRGPDFKKSLEILNNPTCKGKFDVISKTLSQNELPDMYSKADIVVDQFGVGFTGLIGQEAMACEKPLIQYANFDLYKKFYSEVPPIVNAKTEEEILSQLEMLIKNPDKVIEIGKKSREWIIKNHDPEKILKKYIYIYEAIYNKINIDIIKRKIMDL